MPRNETLTSSDSDSENEKRVKAKLKQDDSRKRKAKASSSSAAKKPAVEATTSATVTVEGEEKVSLGKMKFISVREFRGKVYVDIREFYEKDGELRPGKKGVSLQAEQWQKLKQNVDLIDEKLQQLC